VIATVDAPATLLVDTSEFVQCTVLQAPLWQHQWLTEIGKVDTPWCVCDRWTPQNAAHLMICPWVGDGKGRTQEKMWEDEEWCEAVFDFIK